MYGSGRTRWTFVQFIWPRTDGFYGCSVHDCIVSHFTRTFCHCVRSVRVCRTLCCAALLFRNRVDKHTTGAVIQVDVLHFSEIIEAARSNTVAGAIPLSLDAGERSKLKAIRVRAFRCEPDDPIVCDLALRQLDSWVVQMCVDWTINRIISLENPVLCCWIRARWIGQISSECIFYVSFLNVNRYYWRRGMCIYIN